jgi:hypothetical protein
MVAENEVALYQVAISATHSGKFQLLGNNSTKSKLSIRIQEEGKLKCN